MFFPNARKSISLLSTVLTIILMVSILAIALIFQDQTQRSNYFWMRLGWIELMVLICSTFTNSYLLEVIFGENIKEKGGAMPGFGSTIYLYALISSLLVIITSFLPASDLLSRFHLVLQILLFAIFALTYALINFALSGAISGSRSTSNVTPPPQLATKIGVIEKKINNDPILKADIELLRAVKDLKETVSYSIPNAGTYLDSHEYQSFAFDVENFCREISQASIKENDELLRFRKKLIELVINAGSLKRIR